MRYNYEIKELRKVVGQYEILTLELLTDPVTGKSHIELHMTITQMFSTKDLDKAQKLADRLSSEKRRFYSLEDLANENI